LVIAAFIGVESVALIVVNNYVQWGTVLFAFPLIAVLGWLIIVFLPGHYRRAIDAACVSGQMTPEALNGRLIQVAAILFIIPGVLTDVVALVLLFPPFRWIIRDCLMKWWFGPRAGRRPPSPAGER
jgi:UPF0716 family protein affecting phage T7 exclusion